MPEVAETETPMQVHVKLFAVARQVAGRDELLLQLGPSANIADLRQALIDQLPDLAPVADNLMFAVNREYADDHTALSADAEIAVIPPVSGG